MSENIRGITFAEQAVTPADDAIVRRAILGDGVLTGCEVTYSGSTLTLAPGYIIACGRSFQITTAQNFAVVDATSGVARLLLTIDLTQTATEETFNQISFSIEYAAAEDGFVDLIQDDINLSGTKYQIVCAVVSLGTGGIAGIVSKLERTEGGGGGLNFKVVPGLTQPGTAVENTIWVKTERIGSWYFSATQPEGMQEWDVWFQTGTESTVEFNALKKNAVQVYPLSAKQMVDGNLVNVEAMIYQGGKWNDLVLSLMNQVKAFAVKSASNEAWVGKAPSIGNQNNELVLSISASSYPYSDGIVGTEELIDATNYRELTVRFSIISLSKGFDYESSVTVYVLGSLPTTGYGSSYLAKAVAFSQKTAGSKNDITVSIPLDGITGECFVGICLVCTCEGGTATLSASVKEWDLR